MSGERVVTRDLALTSCINACTSLNYYALLIIIVQYSSAFGASSMESGIAAGLYVLGGIASKLLFGRYIELFGRKRTLVTAISVGLGVSLLYLFVTSMPALYVVRLVHGLSYGIVGVCTSDIAAKLVPRKNKGEGLGYYYLSSTISTALGPFIGLTLGGTGDYGLVFLAGTALYTISLALALMVHVEEESLSQDQAREAKGFGLRSMVQASAVPLGLTSMMFYLSYSGVLSFISSYSTEIGVAEAAAYFYLAVSAGTLVSRLTSGKRYDRHGANRVMIPGFVSFMAGMLVFSQTSDSAIFLCTGFFIGYGSSIVYAICLTIVLSRSPEHKYGVTTSTFSMLSDTGTGLGPSIMGAVVALVGYRDMYVFGICVCAVSLAMYLCFHGIREARNEQARQGDMG